MLYRRLEKVQVLINASRQLDKAKPEKKDEVGVAIATVVMVTCFLTDGASESRGYA